MRPCYLIAYAKIIDDKECGVYMQDVYFGGIRFTLEEAKFVARECVTSSKSGSIIPKIVEMEDISDTIPAMNKIVIQFRKIESDMIESEDIILRSSKKRHLIF